MKRVPGGRWRRIVLGHVLAWPEIQFGETGSVQKREKAVANPEHSIGPQGRGRVVWLRNCVPRDSTRESLVSRERGTPYVENKAYMAGQTPFFGDFPATGRTLTRKRWPWPKRPPRGRKIFFNFSSSYVLY